MVRSDRNGVLVLGAVALLGLVAANALGQGASKSTGGAAKKEEARELSAEAEEALLKQGEAKFDSGVPAALEVKRAPTGHVLVRPKINGEEPGWFIFDTGAGVCVISTPKVEELHLRAAGEIPAVGVGGAEGAKLYRADVLALGPMTLHDHPLMATDLSMLKAYLGDEIAGVIGYGVLSRCVGEITIGSKEEPARVALFDPGSFDLEREHGARIKSGAAWSKLKLVRRIPAVAGKVEDHDAWFRLDTGANGFVTMHAGAVEKWNLLEGRDVTDIKLGGVGGFVKGKAGTLRSIEVGGMRHENVKASFALEKKGSFGNDEMDGNLGAEMIRPFVLVLDYQHERAAFLRRETGEPK